MDYELQRDTDQQVEQRRREIFRQKEEYLSTCYVEEVVCNDEFDLVERASAFALLSIARNEIDESQRGRPKERSQWFFSYRGLLNLKQDILVGFLVILGIIFPMVFDDASKSIVTLVSTDAEEFAEMRARRHNRRKPHLRNVVGLSRMVERSYTNFIEDALINFALQGWLPCHKLKEVLVIQIDKMLKNVSISVFWHFLQEIGVNVARTSKIVMARNAADVLVLAKPNTLLSFLITFSWMFAKAEATTGLVYPVKGIFHYVPLIVFPVLDILLGHFVMIWDYLSVFVLPFWRITLFIHDRFVWYSLRYIVKINGLELQEILSYIILFCLYIIIGFNLWKCFRLLCVMLKNLYVHIRLRRMARLGQMRLDQVEMPFKSIVLKDNVWIAESEYQGRKVIMKMPPNLSLNTGVEPTLANAEVVPEIPRNYVGQSYETQKRGSYGRPTKEWPGSLVEFCTVEGQGLRHDSWGARSGNFLYGSYHQLIGVDKWVLCRRHLMKETRVEIDMNGRQIYVFLDSAAFELTPKEWSTLGASSSDIINPATFNAAVGSIATIYGHGNGGSDFNAFEAVSGVVTKMLPDETEHMVSTWEGTSGSPLYFQNRILAAHSRGTKNPTEPNFSTNLFALSLILKKRAVKPEGFSYEDTPDFMQYLQDEIEDWVVQRSKRRLERKIYDQFWFKPTQYGDYLVQYKGKQYLAEPEEASLLQSQLDEAKEYDRVRTEYEDDMADEDVEELAHQHRKRVRGAHDRRKFEEEENLEEYLHDTKQDLYENAFRSKVVGVLKDLMGKKAIPEQTQWEWSNGCSFNPSRHPSFPPTESQTPVNSEAGDDSKIIYECACRKDVKPVETKVEKEVPVEQEVSVVPVVITEPQVEESENSVREQIREEVHEEIYNDLAMMLFLNEHGMKFENGKNAARNAKNRLKRKAKQLVEAQEPAVLVPPQEQQVVVPLAVHSEVILETANRFNSLPVEPVPVEEVPAENLNAQKGSQAPLLDALNQLRQELSSMQALSRGLKTIESKILSMEKNNSSNHQQQRKQKKPASNSTSNGLNKPQGQTQSSNAKQ